LHTDKHKISKAAEGLRIQQIGSNYIGEAQRLEERILGSATQLTQFPV